jgi:hypothetical protein
MTFATQALVGAGVVALAAGCAGSGGGTFRDAEKPGGDSATAEPPAGLCDGSARMRLRFATLARNERELPGSIVRVENGFPSLLLDASCNYYMSGGWAEPGDALGRDRGVRRGKLDGADLEALGRELPLGRLDRLSDCSDAAEMIDGSPRTIADGSGTASCAGRGASFDAAWNWIASRAAKLWAASAPMSGDVWLSAVVVKDGDDSPAFEWPLAEPLRSFIIPENALFESGVSRRVSGPEAQALRRLREDYLSARTKAPAGFYDGQKMSNGGLSAVVYLRDALPYEDERGLSTIARMK